MGLDATHNALDSGYDALDHQDPSPMVTFKTLAATAVLSCLATGTHGALPGDEPGDEFQGVISQVGELFQIGSGEFVQASQSPKAPSGWLCDPDFYSEGIVCDCECGIRDPDCDQSEITSETCESGTDECVGADCVPCVDCGSVARHLLLGSAETVCCNRIFIDKR